MIYLDLHGDPIPWKRPGHNSHTGSIYDEQKKLKEQCRWVLQAQYREDPLTCPLDIGMIFYFPISESTSAVKRTQMLNGVIHHMIKPDVDNLAKFALDTMTGVIFHDDCQVFRLSVEKRYSTKPGTYIQINPLTCDVKKPVMINIDQTMTERDTPKKSKDSDNNANDTGES